VLAERSAPFAFAGPLRFSGRQLAGRLRILQWNHVVDAYDTWFDAWTAAWGEQRDVEVVVDHVDYTTLPALAAAEAKAGKGHDVIGHLQAPVAFGAQVIDHTDVIRTVEREVGPYGQLARRSTYDRAGRRFVGVSDFYVPLPVIWRHDVWNGIGESPADWRRVAAAAPRLRELGRPVGISLAPGLEANLGLLSVLACFGAELQDASNRVALGSRRAVEAVATIAEITRAADPGVVRWDATANNRQLLSDRASLILNAITATRTADALGLPFAPELWLWPFPSGGVARVSHPQHTHVYAIWSFSKNVELAEQLLADLCSAAREATPASKFFGFPSFPGAFPPEELRAAAAEDPALPRGRTSILATVAGRHTVNVGSPGTWHVGVAEALRRAVVSRMFAAAATGRATPDAAVANATWELKRIWRSARAAGAL
jgi:multiple sugar transport system substrate-binding protein